MQFASMKVKTGTWNSGFPKNVNSSSYTQSDLAILTERSACQRESLAWIPENLAGVRFKNKKEMFSTSNAFKITSLLFFNVFK